MMCIVASTLLLVAATVPADTPARNPPPPAFSNEEAVRHYAQGRLLEERGESDQALGEYYRALLLDPRAADVARRVSEVSASMGEVARSLEFAERSLALEPGNARGLWLKGAALFNLGRATESLPLLEAAVAADSDDVEYLRTLARVAEHLDRADLVARACAGVVAVDEEDGEAWFQLATAEARLQDFAAADRAISQAARLNPVRPGTIFVQGWVKEGRGETRTAIELYQRHLAIHRDDQVTRRRLVNLLAQDKRYVEAYHEVQEVSRSTPADLDVLEVETDLAFEAGHAAAGLKVLDRMQRLAHDDPELLGRVVAASSRHGRGRAGVELADAWQSRHPEDCRGPVLAAQARALAGELKAAVETARRGVALCPDSLSPRVLLARLCQKAKLYADAEKVWSDAVRRFPTHVGVALDLAYCREQLGDLAGAQEAARDALRLNPDNPTALNFLGYLLADHNRDLGEAAELINRALQQDPGNGAYIDSLGWVYYRLGRLAEARRELERAVDLTDGDPVVREHLGDVYKDLRLLNLAKEQYRKSLAGDGSNQRVRAKLAEIR